MNPPGQNESKVPGKRKIVVEVGHGSRPLWTTLRKMPLEDHAYFGLDIDSDSWPPRKAGDNGYVYDLAEGRLRIEKKKSEGAYCHWLRIGDGGTLPLRDGVVDELYMAGVLSDPRIPPPVIDNLLISSSLAVRPGGVFVIDNIYGGLSGPGDVVIDFATNQAVFRSSSGELRDEELSTYGSNLLNIAFTPLPREDHVGFLRARGLDERCDPEPGLKFSILVRNGKP